MKPLFDVTDPKIRLSPSKKQKILIVDDHKTNVDLMKAQLKPYNYVIEGAYDGEEALKKVHQSLPDLILLDLMMPKMDGYAVCKILKSDKHFRFIPVIIVTALRELDDKIKAIELGADDFLIKPYNKLELTTRVKSLLHMKELYDDLDTSESILFSLAQALEAKDVYTRGHSERVGHYGCLLGKALGLPEKDIETLSKGCLLHDIGKIGVREAILNKPGPLTKEEFDHIKSHPERGYQICKPLKSLAPTLCIIHHHHERVDGQGYPEGLKDDEIHILAKVAAIVDAYDAMTTNRPYRKGMTVAQAVKTFETERDMGQWDPKLVDVFVDVLKREKL